MQAFAEKSRKREEIKEGREGGREGRERERESGEGSGGREGGREKGIATVAGLPPPLSRRRRRHLHVSGFLNNFSGEREKRAKNI